MKILIIGQHFYPENFRFNDLAQALKERGHEITVLTGVPNYPAGNFFKGYGLFGPFVEYWNGIKIFRAPLIPRKKSKFFLALNYISFPITSTFMALFVLSEKYDAVLICQSSPIFMAIPANVRRFFKKEPTFLWITDLWPESLRATNTIRNPFILKSVEKIVQFVYRNVDHILISCKGFKESITSKGVTTLITYFPYWAEEFYRRLPKVGDLVEDKLVITFAGNIGAAQGLEVLVDAASELKDFNDIAYVIIGEGRGMEDLKRKIASKGLESLFLFPGSYPAEKMPEFFAMSDVLFLSLRKDPIFEITVPSKIQSYMACGKPILASIDGEAASLLKESNAGIVVPAGNATDLAKAIKSLRDMGKQKREEMGDNALRFYEANFQRRSLVDLIDNLLSQK